MSETPAVIGRAIITREHVAAFVAALEPLEDVVWLNRTTRCRRHTLSGVPAKRADVIVDEQWDSGGDPRDHLVIEVLDKPGRYDGAVRRRYCIRWLRGSECRDLLPVDVTVDVTNRHVIVSITAPAAQEIGMVSAIAGFSEEWPRVAAVALDADRGPDRIMLWHWTRYYQFLPEAEVASLCLSWGASRPEGETLNAANRSASRELYALARALGWRKLTLRERARLGLDSTWVREADYAAAQERRSVVESPVGEATRRAAHWTDDDIDVITAEGW